MGKFSTTYECSECGAISASYMGKCASCGRWGSLIEKKVAKTPSTSLSPNKRQAVTETLTNGARPIRLCDVVAEKGDRFSSGFPELDRVLGGGILPGAYVLIGGDPGIGKSTLMLQMAAKVLAGQPQATILYTAGEESPFQIRQRAERLGIQSDRLLLFAENNIHAVLAEIRTNPPDILIVDSIQSVYSPDLAGTPGSVGQIKECAGLLMTVAKALNITIFLVGHVTKEGTVSGPKLLEHTVDAVLYFEGEKYKNLRILRTVKNRFGGTNEIGVFEMGAGGLREVTNPSELFLSESSYQNNPGSVIVATLEGSRPMLVEIQALVGASSYSNPKRVANGTDTNRLHQIIAVLERRLGLDFSRFDVYVNVVGGLKLDEPAVDLGMALAIITSQRDLAMQPGTVVAGEIGLTGEIRPIRNVEDRIREASRIGFKRMIAPTGKGKSATKNATKGLTVIGVESVMDAIRASLAPPSAGKTPSPLEALNRRPSSVSMEESLSSEELV